MSEDQISVPPAPGKVAKQVITTPDTSPFITGRRDFFKYRDLGTMEATNGGMHATVTKGTIGIVPTGWHYHELQVQFLYFLKGWVKLEFEDGTTHIFKEGDSCYIPNGVKHNELEGSDDFEVLEVLMPGEIKTISCDQPA